MQRSTLDMGSADASAGGMSISSSSGAWHGHVVFVVWRLCHSPIHGVCWSGPQLDVLGEELVAGMECRGLRDGFFDVVIAVGTQWTPPNCPSLGRASWREEAQYDVRELLLHCSHRALAGVDAGRVPEKDPRMSNLARVQHLVQCGCELQDRGRRDGPAVLRRDVVSALLGQDGVCLGRLLDQHVQRAMVHAEGDRECRRLLCVAPHSWACFTSRSDAPAGGGRRSRRCSRRGLRWQRACP